MMHHYPGCGPVPALHPHSLTHFCLLRVQPPLDGHLQPGATFGGLLDLGLGSSSSRCHQLSVMLETEEVVSPQHCAGRAGQPGRVMRTLHCEYQVGGHSLTQADSTLCDPPSCCMTASLSPALQEITTDAASSHFLFTIPASATPSFCTPMVSLRWALHFELLVGPPIDYTAMDRTSKSAHQHPALQQLLWALPLVVTSPVPMGLK